MTTATAAVSAVVAGATIVYYYDYDGNRDYIHYNFCYISD